MNVWQHALVTVAADATVTFYINGVQTGTPAATGALSGITTTNDLIIGNRAGTTDRTFDGWIDEPIMWNRALTAQEISDLYVYGAVPTSGLVDGYRCDEGAGSVLNSFSSSPNNGAITGATFSGDVPMKGRKLINGEMVINGSFEYAPPLVGATTGSAVWVDGSVAGSTNDLFGWYKINGAGAFAASFDPTTTYQGKPSIKLESTNSTGRGRLLSAPTETNTTAAIIAKYGIPVKPNTAYTLSANIKTAGADSASVRLIWLFYTGDGTQSGGGTGTNQASTQDFTPVTERFVTASNTSFVVIKLDDNVATAVAHQTWYNQVSLLPAYPEMRSQVVGNLVRNAEFERVPFFVAATTTQSRWVDGSAAGSTTNESFKWKQQSGANATAVSFDSTVSHGGSYSLKVSATDVTGSTYVDIGAGIASTQPVAQLQKFAIPISPGLTYVLTGWIKTNNVPTNGAFLQLTTYDALGTRVDNVGSSVKLTGTQDWTQITITQTVGASAVWATVGLMKNVAGNISDAWFDDISLLPVYQEVRAPVYGNLVKNAGFEVAPTFTAAQTTKGTWNDGSAAGSATNSTYKWGFNSTNSVGTGSVQFDTTNPYAGLQSLKVSTLATGATAVASNMLNTSVAQLAFTIPVLPNTSYSYSFAMRTNYGSGDSADGACLQFKERNTAATTIQTTQSTKVKTTSGWTVYTGSFTTQATTRFIDIEPSVLGNTGAATLIMDAWFDEIVLIQTTPVVRTAVT